MNFRHQPVVDEMKNVLRFWLKQGAYGFRVDAVNHLFEVADLRDEPIDNPDDPLSYGYTKKDYTKDLVRIHAFDFFFTFLTDELMI